MKGLSYFGFWACCWWCVYFMRLYSFDRHLREGDDPQFGNVWTFCAIDSDTKLVPAFRAGQRDEATRWRLCGM
jgi:hypothetical protein